MPRKNSIALTAARWLPGARGVVGGRTHRGRSREWAGAHRGSPVVGGRAAAGVDLGDVLGGELGGGEGEERVLRSSSMPPPCEMMLFCRIRSSRPSRRPLTPGTSTTMPADLPVEVLSWRLPEAMLRRLLGPSVIKFGS